MKDTKILVNFFEVKITLVFFLYCGEKKSFKLKLFVHE